MKISKTQEKISQSVIDEIEYGKMQKTLASLNSIDAVKSHYALPVTNGASEKERIAMDEAFGGGYGTIYESLAQHATELGQFPMTSFVGYGVLQNIAQNGMIRACVQTVADDMTREWITVVGGDDSEKTKIEKIQDLQENKYRLRRIFNEGFSIMGYMGGAFIFIDTGEEDTSIPLILSEKSAEFSDDRPLRFVVVDPVNVSPCVYNSSQPLKSDYMKPTMWLVLGKRVHHTRLIPLVDNVPPTLLKPAYNFLGIPQAQILWDYVIHWNNARVDACTLVRKLNLVVFKTTAMDFLSDQDGLAQLDAKVNAMNRYRSNESIFVCNADGEEVENITLSLSGVTDVVKQSLEFVAAINRTPAVKLLGISPSGFNSTGESDIRNYYDHIHSKQEKFRDALIKVLKAIQLKHFKSIDSSIGFEFRELSQSDDKDKINNSRSKIDTWLSLQDHGVISPEETRSIVRTDPEIGLDFLDEEVPEDAQNVNQSEMDTPAMQGLFGGMNGESGEVDEIDAGNPPEPRDEGMVREETDGNDKLV